MSQSPENPATIQPVWWFQPRQWLPGFIFQVHSGIRYVCSFLTRKQRSYVRMNPKYHPFLMSMKWTAPEDFLQLSGEIISGHPDRHVTRLIVTQANVIWELYLKREHRVRWRDRLVHACSWRGWVSRSQIEASILRDLKHSGIGCPDVMAHGEDATGRAFVLVKAIPDSKEIRSWLKDIPSGDLTRYQAAKILGQTLAKIHEKGFDNPDLGLKHILIQSSDLSISILDWQRGIKRKHVNWTRRCQQLAALNATLGDHLITHRERLHCLASYLRNCRSQPRRSSLIKWLTYYDRHYRRRRRFVEQQLDVPQTDDFTLYWMQGESLCVTKSFWMQCRGQLPDWLTAVPRQRLPLPSWRRTSLFPRDDAPIELIQRSDICVLKWMWSRLRGRRLDVPEIIQAGLLFRLQRHGVVTPRLLAFGHQCWRPWQIASFLLTQPVPNVISWQDWMHQSAPTSRAGLTPCRDHLAYQLGDMLRRIHQAGCWLSIQTVAQLAAALAVRTDAHGPPRLALTSVPAIRTGKWFHTARQWLNVRLASQLLRDAGYSRTDQLRFLLGYLAARRVTPENRLLWRRLTQVR